MMLSVFSPPKVALTAIGVRLKNAPHPIPLNMRYTEKMPIDDDRGHTMRELRAMKSMQIARLSTGPRRVSATHPAITRPRVDAKFQQARMTIPISLV